MYFIYSRRSPTQPSFSTSHRRRFSCSSSSSGSDLNPPKLALLLPGFVAGAVCVLISNVAVDKLPGNSLSSRDLMVNGWLVGWRGQGGGCETKEWKKKRIFVSSGVWEYRTEQKKKSLGLRHCRYIYFGRTGKGNEIGKGDA